MDRRGETPQHVSPSADISPNAEPEAMQRRREADQMKIDDLGRGLDGRGEAEPVPSDDRMPERVEVRRKGYASIMMDAVT